MSFLDIKNVKIAGFSTALPKRTLTSQGFLEAAGHAETAETFIRQVGIVERRESKTLTASDLSYEAGERLIADLGWAKDSIDAVLMVTISPDYILPINACILQDRLGLSKECYAQDVSMGCSGWVYALSVVAALMENGNVKRALMFSGESRKHWGEGNNEMLFGNAVCATALEYEPGHEGFKFQFGTDGGGYDAVIMPHSGMRREEYTPEDIKRFEDPEFQRSYDGAMKNLDVFAFSITRVPASINALAERHGFDYHDCDYLVLHQANKSINERIVRKLKMDPEKAITSIPYLGNTLAASIPVTIATQLRGKIENKKTKFLCCGFGVGLSWGTVTFTTENIVISETVEVEEDKFKDVKWV